MHLLGLLPVSVNEIKVKSIEKGGKTELSVTLTDGRYYVLSHVVGDSSC